MFSDDSKFGFTNAAFDGGGEEDEEDEIHEIRRVSQVPFNPDSDTYLNKVNLQFSIHSKVIIKAHISKQSQSTCPQRDWFVA